MSYNFLLTITYSNMFVLLWLDIYVSDDIYKHTYVHIVLHVYVGRCGACLG